MKIKRIDVIVQFILTLILIVATIMAFMNLDKVMIGYSTGLLVWSINNLRISRCPHCKKRGLRPNPFKANAGPCKYCDELVEYDVEYE